MIQKAPRHAPAEGAPAETPSGAKLLRQEGDVQMWQERADGFRRKTGRLVQYIVRRPGTAPRLFDKPQDAWNYFREITGIAETNPVVGSSPPGRRR